MVRTLELLTTTTLVETSLSHVVGCKGFALICVHNQNAWQQLIIAVIPERVILAQVIFRTF
jgi:hypothetical protein